MPEPVTMAFALVILYSLVVVETLFVVLAFRSAPALSWLESAERWLGRLAARRGLSVAAVGALALAGRAALAPALPIREPLVTHEFSYLLPSDTLPPAPLPNPPPP